MKGFLREKYLVVEEEEEEEEDGEEIVKLHCVRFSSVFSLG